MKLVRALAKPANLIVALLMFGSIILFQGCSYQEALSGKREDMVGSHQVTIKKPCRLFTENSTVIENVPGEAKYEYTCGETKVTMLFKDDELAVNGKSYGRISEGDAVVFDHGKVFINSREVQEIASR